METPKLSIEKDGKPLQVYVMTAQPGQTYTEIPTEKLGLFLAYDDDHATQIIRSHFPQGSTFSFRKRATLPVKNILMNLSVPVLIKDEKPALPPEVKKEITEREFVYGLMLSSDKFIVNDADKKALKDIISRIEWKHESNSKSTVA